MATDRFKPIAWIRWLHRLGVEAGARTIDAAFGVSTTLGAPATPWQDYDPNAFRSKPYGWTALIRVFRGLRVDRNDAFLDIGCGAGRAVVCASLFPFRRLIGVELDAAVCDLAQRNAATVRVRGRERIAFECKDASDYAIPDDITVIFMYNPFGGAVFEQVLANVFASLDRAPRRLRFVYSNPKEHDFLLQTGRCSLVERYRGLRPTASWASMLAAHVYELQPSPQAAATVLPGDQPCVAIQPARTAA